MAKGYSTPGVYTNEIATALEQFNTSLPTVPIFVGFTEKTSYQNRSLLYQPVPIASMTEFESFFGTLPISNWEWDSTNSQITCTDEVSYRLYHSLQLYFDNGGGACYVVSTGTYRKTMDSQLAVVRFEKALQYISKQPDSNVMVWADAHLAGESLIYPAYQQALQLGNTRKDWMVLIDLYSKNLSVKYESLRSNFELAIGHTGLRYGAAYYPYLQTVYKVLNDESRCRIKVDHTSYFLKFPPDHPEADRSLYSIHPSKYATVRKIFEAKKVVLPSSPAVAGLMCQRQLWKASANQELQSVEKTMVTINQALQELMTVPPSGKSVNAVRSFIGRGVLVWGARTLNSHDNEWRYIPVVRFAGAVEKTITKGLTSFKSSPNNESTWTAIKSVITSFLDSQWRQGALAGDSPSKAFYCKIGLGSTMTQQDVLDNKIIVEVGLAMLKPAEFLVLNIISQRN